MNTRSFSVRYLVLTTLSILIFFGPRAWASSTVVSDDFNDGDWAATTPQDHIWQNWLYDPEGSLSLESAGGADGSTAVRFTPDTDLYLNLDVSTFIRDNFNDGDWYTELPDGLEWLTSGEGDSNTIYLESGGGADGSTAVRFEPLDVLYNNKSLYLEDLAEAGDYHRSESWSISWDQCWFDTDMDADENVISAPYLWATFKVATDGGDKTVYLWIEIGHSNSNKWTFVGIGPYYKTISGGFTNYPTGFDPLDDGSRDNCYRYKFTKHMNGSGVFKAVLLDQYGEETSQEYALFNDASFTLAGATLKEGNTVYTISDDNLEPDELLFSAEGTYDGFDGDIDNITIAPLWHSGSSWSFAWDECWFATDLDEDEHIVSAPYLWATFEVSTDGGNKPVYLWLERGSGIQSHWNYVGIGPYYKAIYSALVNWPAGFDPLDDGSRDNCYRYEYIRQSDGGGSFVAVKLDEYGAETEDGYTLWEDSAFTLAGTTIKEGNTVYTVSNNSMALEEMLLGAEESVYDRYDADVDNVEGICLINDY